MTFHWHMNNMNIYVDENEALQIVGMKWIKSFMAILMLFSILNLNAQISFLITNCASFSYPYIPLVLVLDLCLTHKTSFDDNIGTSISRAFILWNAPCLMHTPLLWTWLGHPSASVLHRLTLTMLRTDQVSWIQLWKISYLQIMINSYGLSSSWLLSWFKNSIDVDGRSITTISDPSTRTFFLP